MVESVNCPGARKRKPESLMTQSQTGTNSTNNEDLCEVQGSLQTYSDCDTSIQL